MKSRTISSFRSFLVVSKLGNEECTEMRPSMERVKDNNLRIQREPSRWR
jgi:hypothetical protein